MVQVIGDEQKTTAKARIEVIDPKKAAALLEHNACGRPLRAQEVARKVRDMLQGDWDFTGDTIKIAKPDKDGIEHLLDGQHRMTAVVTANIRKQFLVVRGLPRRVRDVTDTGIPRTPGDTFQMNGLPYGTLLAATARLILSDGGRTHYRPTRAELLKTVAGDENLLWVVNVALPKHPDLKKLLTPSVFAYTYLRLHQLDPAACADFFDRLDSLDNLTKGHPILTLNQRLSRHDRRGNHLNARVIPISYVFQAWNAYRREEMNIIIKVIRTKDGGVVIPEPI